MSSFCLEKKLSNQKIKDKVSLFGIRGFTLVELMITVSIFVFMTAVIMAKYSSFYSGTVFKNLAFDVALTIRQAQTYGISVKGTAEGNFSQAYGVFISYSAPTLSNTFILYSYTKSGTQYNLGSLEKKYILKQGAKFSAICAGSASTSCTALDQGDSLSIVFQRPNPEAIICKTSNEIMDCTSNKFARITLVAGDDVTTRDIEVTNVGQISVK